MFFAKQIMCWTNQGVLIVLSNQYRLNASNDWTNAHLKIGFDSIIEQTYKNIEIVISDHSKNDDIENLIIEYQKINRNIVIKYFRYNEKYGNISANINNAIKNCDGDIIKIMFMDDYLINKHYSALI